MSSEPTFTPPTDPQPAPAPRRNIVARLGIGCLGMIALGCAALGGLFVYETRQQEQNYAAGNAAYMAADCAAAIDPLDKAARGEPGTAESDVAFKAQAELQQCNELLAADAAATSDPATALLGYSAILTKYDNSPLVTPALSQGQAVISSSAPEQLATPDLCNTLDTLITQTIITAPATTMPTLLFACGIAAENAGAYSEALAFYEQVLDEYLASVNPSELEAAIVRATLAEATASGAGFLPAPLATGESSGDAGFATVVIQNDSPESLRMVFSGPDVRVEDLESCEECASFGDDEPEFCPEIGPVATYTLAPGTYDVVVKASSDGGVTPFRGNWTLEAGEEYSSCFYIVSGE